jgi:hypothetical protein
LPAWKAERPSRAQSGRSMRSLIILWL